MARFGFSTGWVGRLATAILRRVRPILFLGTKIPGWVILTKRADIIDALTRNDVFSVAIYGQRMVETLGPFFLGMDDTPQYKREWSAAHAAIRRDDLERVRALVRNVAQQCVEGARARRSIDVVAELAEPVHLGFTADYFGIPGSDGRSADVLRWLRTTSFYIFNFWAAGAFEMAAVRAGAEVQAYVSEQIAARKRTGATTRDDFLERLLGTQRAGGSDALDDETIRRVVTGCVSGSLEPGIGCFVRIIDHLLDIDHSLLQTLQRAARSQDDTMVLGFLLEAARFNPYPPYAFRHCKTDYVMAPGTSRQRTISAGATVVPVLQSAMFDHDAVRHPNTFDTTRRQDTYLNFGYGQHLCLGKDLAEVILTEMAKPLLALRGLRRADGRNGKLRNGPAGTIPDGYFTRHLTLEFEP